LTGFCQKQASKYLQVSTGLKNIDFYFSTKIYERIQEKIFSSEKFKKGEKLFRILKITQKIYPKLRY